MYISRVEVDLNNRQRSKDLTHVGAFHSWVENSFQINTESKARKRKLWRIDNIHGKTFLLIVSENEPDLENLEKYGIKNSAQTKDYTKFLNSLKNGMKLKFRVTLNPVISVSSENSKRGRVFPHITKEYQMKYLMDRSHKNGFDLKENDFTIIDRGYALFQKKGSRDLRLVKVTYEGVLTIVDEEHFKDILCYGFGKKKAYGFGLMTVARLNI